MTEENEHNGSAPKITQDKLLEELENGKTQKEIAHEYGYGHASRKLEDKIRDLGFEQNQKMSLGKWGGFQAYVNGTTTSKALEKAGLKDTEKKYFKSNVKSDGTIEIVPTDKKWRKEDE